MDLDCHTCVAGFIGVKVCGRQAMVDPFNGANYVYVTEMDAKESKW